MFILFIILFLIEILHWADSNTVQGIIKDEPGSNDQVPQEVQNSKLQSLHMNKI